MKDTTRSGRFLFGSYTFQQEIEFKKVREEIRQKVFGVSDSNTFATGTVCTGSMKNSLVLFPFDLFPRRHGKRVFHACGTGEIKGE